MKILFVLLLCILSLRVFCEDFKILGINKDMTSPFHLEKIEFSYKGDREVCYFDKSHAKNFETIVVYSHSYGGSEKEIYNFYLASE
ncbi:MAG: hypothetical protein IJS60_02930 [Abditibacteriota bacterium]|nr:hypothetical protein [Abditibacteriota bacterium]